MFVDPLAEKTMEPYSYVSNNPVNMVDPTGMKGEDWIFHFHNETFIGVTDTGKGSAIRFKINGKEMSLNPRNAANSKYFAIVSKYIVGQVNAKLNVSYKIVDEKSRTGGYHVSNTNNVTITDRSFETNNFYDIKSNAIHEDDHYKRGPVRNYLDHVETYFNEARSKNFSKTSISKRHGHAIATAQRLINAYANGDFGGDGNAFIEYVNEYNILNPDFKLDPDTRGVPSIKVGNDKENINPNLEMRYEQ